MPWPPGASPLLAASQSGSSFARNVSHCLLPSFSQLVYRLQAPPAGATTEMPLPASVFIALPTVTQLLTSGAALNASSSTTACGPPAMNDTGMSRPIAADGTISCSTAGWAVAVAVETVTPTAASTAAHIIRKNTESRFICPLQSCPSPRRPRVVNHIAVIGCAQNGRRRRSPHGDRRRRRCSSVVVSGAIPGWPSRRGHAEHPLDVRLHLLQLLTPVTPAVGTGVREVEHTVLPARGDVLLLEGLVGPHGEPLQELRVEVVALGHTGADVGRGAVTAEHPDAGVVGDQLVDVDHRVVALPGAVRILGAAPHVVGVVAAGVTHGQPDQHRPPALGQV